MNICEIAIEEGLRLLDIEKPTLYLIRTSRDTFSENVEFTNRFNSKYNKIVMYFHTVLTDQLTGDSWELLSTEHNKYFYSPGA